MPISSLHSDHDNPITVLKGHLQLIEMGTPWHWRIDDCTHPQPGITHHTASYERSFGKCFATMGKVYKRASWILCVQSRKWCLSTNGYLIILRAFAMALTSAIFPVPDDLPLRHSLVFINNLWKLIKVVWYTKKWLIQKVLERKITLSYQEKTNK